jgi:hypothetical protein
MLRRMQRQDCSRVLQRQLWQRLREGLLLDSEQEREGSFEVLQSRFTQLEHFRK